jgi:hypothetical protein
LDSSGDFRDFEDLNSDPEEINAVRVITARQTTPIHSFFGRVFGVESYQARATAVAYVGFAGKILPGEVDWPIAMCYENVNKGCSVGRLIPDPGDTGGWTNLQQPGGGTTACGGSASASQVTSLITGCGGGINPTELILGWDMQTNNGQIDSVFNPTYDCWSKNDVKLGSLRFPGKLAELDTDGDGRPDKPWKMLLPVIDCTTKPGGRCNMLVGAVLVDVLWIFDDTTNTNKLNRDAPWSMTRTGPDGALITWNARTDPDITDVNDGQQRWNEFVKAFNLKEPDGVTPAQWRAKTIYYAPDCSPSDALGGTGGANFGIRATVPVLVF